jgi:anaerobic magnesium-protoporphyrin IX monomethyl ester cyclase
MKSILFINPPNKLFTEQKSLEAGLDQPGIPLGCLYLSAYIKNLFPGIKSELLDLQFFLWKEIKQFLSLEDFFRAKLKLVKTVPNICAISLSFNANGESYLLLTRLLKEYWPKTKIVIGGPIVTGDPALFITDDNLDYLCLGEGEIPLKNLIGNLSTGKVPISLGLYSRTELSDLLKTSGSPLYAEQIHSIDGLPIPDYSLLEDRAKDYSFGIITSRGCPNRCSYCSHSIVAGKRMRFRDEDQVMHEIDMIRSKFNVQTLDIYDSNPGIRPRLFNSLIRKVLQRHPNLKLSFNPEITHLTEPALKTYYEMGLRELVVSMESGSSYVLTKLMFRKNYIDKARHLIKYAHDLGFRIRSLFVLGVPGETAEMRQETLSYARSLPADWCTFYIATPVPGSYIYMQLKESGSLKVETPYQLGMIKFRYRSFDLPEMSASEIMETQDLFEGIVNFVDPYLYRTGKWQLALGYYQAIVNRFPQRIRAHLAILRIHHELSKNGNEKHNPESVNDKLKEIRHLLKNNSLALAEFKKYSSNEIYNPLFDVYHSCQ